MILELGQWYWLLGHFGPAASCLPADPAEAAALSSITAQVTASDPLLEGVAGGR